MVLVLNNAAGLNVGESESFCEEFFAAALFDDFFERLAFEIHDRTVGADGARMNAFDIAGFLHKRDFDVGLIGALLGEDLDAHIFDDGGTVGGGVFFVHVARAVEDHGVCAGLGGVVFQGQVGGRYREPIVAGGGGARSDGGGAKD
jgi:hypothetical protein